MKTFKGNKAAFWLAKVFRSIKRYISWDLIWTLVGIIGLGAIVMVTVHLTDSAWEWIRDKFSSEDKYYVSEEMGNDYEVRTYYDGPDCIAKADKRRAIVKDIEWVNGDDEDSLWVVAKNDRRAYFNTNSGKFVSKFIYRKAWRYSEGIAAVLDESGSLIFIDPQGKLAIEKAFYHNQQKAVYYQFHSGLCPMADSAGLIGLINRSGNWVIEPQYDSVARICEYWSMMCNDSLTVIDTNGHTLIELTAGNAIALTSDGDIEVKQKYRPGRLYDNKGNLLASQTYQDVERIAKYDDYYNDDEGDLETNVLKYYTDSEHCGLMTRDGKILTEAKYESIEAINETLFKAVYDMEDGNYEAYDAIDAPTYVLLNDKGELVGR